MSRDFRTRLFYFFGACIPLLLLAAVTTWLLYRTQQNANTSVLLSDQFKTLQIAENAIASTLDSVKSDLTFLAAQTALQESIGETLPSAKQEMARTFLAFVASKRRYDQLRLLDVKGKEQIRINWEGGHPVIVPPSELQEKSSRYYVKAGLKLASGQIYVSQFDLNEEHGRIEQPIKPMIRFVTPVTDASGQINGLVILNVIGDKVLQDIDSAARQEHGTMWLLNDRGYWLHGGAPGDNWAFMYPDSRGKSLSSQNPLLWLQISQADVDVQTQDRGNIYTFSRIRPVTSSSSTSSDVNPPSWFLVSVLPASFLSAQRAQLRHKFLIAYGGLAIILVVAAAFFSGAGVRRHFAETKLRSSESQFRLLLEAAPDAIVVIDSSGRIVLTNVRAEEAFGYRKDELLEKPVEILVPEAIARQHIQHRSNYLQSPKTRPMGAGLALYARRKNGSEFPVEISLSPVSTEAGLLVFSAIRDVTDQRKVERQIKELNEALSLQNGQLMVVNKELEAFSYSVSHDLRSPLRAIDGFSKILLTELETSLSPQHRDYLQRVRRGAQRMGELIDDLLNLSRITRLEVHYSDVDLSLMVRNVFDSLIEQDPGRSITLQVDEGMQVVSDERLLRVALENLLGNAFKFSARTADAEVKVGCEVIDGQRTYYVSDNGAGFDMAYADKLFGAFQRLHSVSDFPGSGIGLATVQRIIHKLGGRIWAASAVGEGATFYFTLKEKEFDV